MSPALRGVTGLQRGPPRASGDEPDSRLSNARTPTSAPRERG